MATPVQAEGCLAQLKARLQGGVSPAIRRNRPANQEARDREALSGWPGIDPDGDLAPLAGIRSQGWNAAAASKVIGTVTQRMRAERSFLTAVLFAPDSVLESLLKPDAGGAPSARSAGRDIDAWVAMCLTCEAVWDAVNNGEFDDPFYAVGDAELLRPIAARIRFLVLTEPMRWRGETAGTCWAQQADKDYGENGVLSRTFGIESWHLLVSRCLEARRVWLDYLNTYQSHPLLSQAEPDELEDELAALIFRQPEAGFSTRASAPLGLSARRLARTAPLTAGDKAIISETADRHLLPRFALPAMIRLAFASDSPGGRRARMVYGIPAAVAALVAVGLSAGLLIHQATIVAAVFYLLVCAGVVALGRNWSSVWLLRMPAASAVGVIALLSFLPGDWLQGPADGMARDPGAGGRIVRLPRGGGPQPRGSGLGVSAAGASGCGRGCRARADGQPDRAGDRGSGLREQRPEPGVVVEAPWLPPFGDGTGLGDRLVPGRRSVLPDPVGRSADHRAAGTPQLAEQMTDGMKEKR